MSTPPRDILTTLIQTCSIGTPSQRDALLRTMTGILQTLQKLIHNLTVDNVKEKHRQLNLSNPKLIQALALNTMRAPVTEVLHAIGYQLIDNGASLRYVYKTSVSKTWSFEINRAIGVVRSKSVIAMREQMHR